MGECSDCGRENGRLMACLATCCEDAPTPWTVCEACWPRHYAQFFLDARATPYGSYGASHAEVVEFMVQFREHR